MTYPIWRYWYKVAGPLNKFIPWLTFILAGLWFFLLPLHPIQGYRLDLMLGIIWRFILVVLAGIFYLIFLRSKIRVRDLSSDTHIWLIICFILSLFAGYSGIFIWIQFLLVGILSDVPFWEALF